MRKRHSDSGADEAAIDLTPMLDIVFIMLIFFIVTTSFVKESGVEINRPSASTAETVKKGNIMVAVRENGQVWVDKRVVEVGAVRANIERLRAENPESAVVIQADDAHGTLAQREGRARRSRRQDALEPLAGFG